MYLQQSFRGSNKFTQYLTTTIYLFLSTQVLGTIIILIAAGIIALLGGDIDLSKLSNLSSMGIDKNIALVIMLTPFVIGFFTLVYCIKKIHKKKLNDVLTTRPKFDFKRAGKGALIWSILLILTSIPALFSDNSTIEFNFQAGPFIGLVFVCLIILPFQTSFEELMFRGYYMQGFAVTTKTRWAPLLVTSLVFGLLHSANPEVQEFGFWMAMPSYVIMGLIMGLVVIMDNGLELAIGMHFANNFLSAILFTSPSSVFQTPALFNDTNPTMGGEDYILLISSCITFLIVCAIIFKWKDWGKIFRKIEVRQ